MKRLTKKIATNDYGKRITKPDVRPLSQRETKMDTRKGMTAKQEVINISFLEHQQKLPLFGNPYSETKT
jgi:hypothetical protein